jgi:hypothetical protein
VLAWIVGVVIVAALAVLLVDLVRDASTLQSDLSGATEGRDAAGRITTVLATGDLAPPEGMNVVMTPQCEAGSGAPMLTLTYAGTTPAAPSPAAAVTAALEARGWTAPATGPAPLLRKRFGDWEATASVLDPAATPASVTLTVQADRDADCSTFVEELVPVLRLAGP